MKTENKYLKSSLKDCGFQEETAARYLYYAEASQISDMLRLLKQQRRKLMDDLHAAQKKVDTIDFMIRSVEQKRRRTMNNNRYGRIPFDKIEGFLKENLK